VEAEHFNKMKKHTIHSASEVLVGDGCLFIIYDDDKRTFSVPLSKVYQWEVIKNERKESEES